MKARGKSVPIGPNADPQEFPKLVQLLLTSQSRRRPHHRKPYKEPEFPIIMADCCFAQDAPGMVLFTILDMLDIPVGMMAAFSVEEVSSVAVVGQTLRMDPEPLRRKIPTAEQETPDSRDANTQLADRHSERRFGRSCPRPLISRSSMAAGALRSG